MVLMQRGLLSHTNIYEQSLLLNLSSHQCTAPSKTQVCHYIGGPPANIMRKYATGQSLLQGLSLLNFSPFDVAVPHHCSTYIAMVDTKRQLVMMYSRQCVPASGTAHLICPSLRRDAWDACNLFLCTKWDRCACKICL